jgi:hypothetical protein
MTKYSSDKKVKFTSKNHKYVHKELGVFESVTTLIGRHFPPFNEKEVARFLAKLPWAKKQKKGVRYWLKDWEAKRSEGTLIHAEIETLINDQKRYNILKPVLNPRTVLAFEGFHKFLKTVGEPVVTPELLIYDKDFKIAGQIDCLIEVNADEGIDREIILVDWKATKDITFDYKYNNPDEATGTSEITKHLSNSNGNKYSLQLSIYAYMLEKQGYIIKGLYIGHVSNKEFKLIPVDYMKSIALQVLESK